MPLFIIAHRTTRIAALTNETESTLEKRTEAFAQMLASWAIEDFKPDARFRALLDGYIAGKLTLDEIRAGVVNEFTTSVEIALPKKSNWRQNVFKLWRR